MFVCAPVHVYNQSDRCWTTIVMGFNVYWAALLSGRFDSLLAGCNCKIWEAWKTWQCTVAVAQNHDEGRGGRTVTGVHGSVIGIQQKAVNGCMEKRVHTEV